MLKTYYNNIYSSRYLVRLFFIIVFGITLFYLETPKLIEETSIIYRYQGSTLKVLIYLATFGLSIISLALLFFNRSSIIAYLSLFLFGSLLFVNLGYKELNGIGIQYEDLLLLFQNRGFSLGDQAFLTYFPNLLMPSLTAILMAIGITFLRFTISKPRFGYLSLVFPICAFVLSTVIIKTSNANRLSIPSFFKIPSLISYTFQNNLYSLGREQVFNIPITTESHFDHIVWIVDESVRGDHLQINNPLFKTTPFLDSVKNNQIINFGVASSGAVCSDYSHIMLMSGLKPSQIPDKISRSRKNPTIFQYAKKAGYNTSLIYAPGYEDKPKGYMTQSDFNYLDTRYQTEMLNPNLPAYQWDFKSIDYLKDIVNNNKKSFTYFLKYGAHFHYEHSYPTNKKIFSPTQNPESFARDDRQLLINSYHNALRWTVDDFFKQINDQLKGKNIVIIYTSDHGQNLMDHKDIILTHCVKEKAPQEMAAVPLFIYSRDSTFKEHKLMMRTTYQNKSHFNIFPTTLELMGFDSLAIQDYYYQNLFAKSQNQNLFISGDLYGRSRMYKNEFDHSKYDTLIQ